LAARGGEFLAYLRNLFLLLKYLLSCQLGAGALDSGIFDCNPQQPDFRYQGLHTCRISRRRLRSDKNNPQGNDDAEEHNREND